MTWGTRISLTYFGDSYIWLTMPNDEHQALTQWINSKMTILQSSYMVQICHYITTLCTNLSIFLSQAGSLTENLLHLL